MNKIFTKQNVLVWIAFFALAAIGVWADAPKVPAEIGVRIRNVQLDQARIQSQILQLQNQYQAMQQTLQHDAGELDSLKKEALASAKLDSTWDVDLDKLEFVAKPKAPEAKK